MSIPRDGVDLRVRCERDDGSSDHYAFDIEQPTPMDPRGPMSMMLRVGRCACRGRMLAILPGGAEPSETNPRPTGPADQVTMRADHPVLRVRCPQDDGAATHYAVDVHAPAALDPKGPLMAVSRMSKCGCGASMKMLATGAEEPRERHARKAQDGGSDAP